MYSYYNNKERYTESKTEEIVGCFVTNIVTCLMKKNVGKEPRKITFLPKKEPKQMDI